MKLFRDDKCSLCDKIPKSDPFGHFSGSKRMSKRIWRNYPEYNDIPKSTSVTSVYTLPPYAGRGRNYYRYTIITVLALYYAHT